MGGDKLGREGTRVKKLGLGPGKARLYGGERLVTWKNPLA